MILPDTDQPLADWVENGDVLWRPPESSPSTSAYNAMRSVDPEEAVLLTTADHPLLTPEIVDAFGRQSLADDVDVAVGLAPHALVTEASEQQLEPGRTAVVSGVIRAGRTDAQKAEIADRLSAALAEIAGVDVATVHTSATPPISARLATLAGGAVSAKFLSFESGAPPVAAQTAYGRLE